MIFRAGSLMIAKIFMMGTKFASNDNYHRDLIWLQSQILNGPHMLAIPFSRDQRCLLSSKICFPEIRPKIKVKRLHNDFRYCRHIFSLLNWIASIFDPFRI